MECTPFCKLSDPDIVSIRLRQRCRQDPAAGSYQDETPSRFPAHVSQDIRHGLSWDCSAIPGSDYPQYKDPGETQ